MRSCCVNCLWVLRGHDTHSMIVSGLDLEVASNITMRMISCKPKLVGAASLQLMEVSGVPGGARSSAVPGPRASRCAFQIVVKSAAMWR